MNVHKNARLTPRGREQMVRAVIETGRPMALVSRDFAVSRHTVAKWIVRYRAQGLAGLQDRSCRPHCLAGAKVAALAVRIERLRRRRLTYRQIATRVGLSVATVCRAVCRMGLNRLSALEPKAPVQRYQRESPGELIHIDIKKLARIERVGHRITGKPADRSKGAGYECVYVAVDDRSRVAFAQILPNEQQRTASAFLKAAIAYYERLGVKVLRVMTDNGPAFTSRTFAQTCLQLRLRHVRTRPYTPRTNGKAERFIQSALREWAYVRAYRHSDVRTAYLAKWIHHYNWHRPHTSLDGKPPLSIIALSVNNLLQLHN